MRNNIIIKTTMQSIVGIPFITVSLIFWMMRGAILGARAAAAWTIRMADKLETLLPSWQEKAERAATDFTLATIRMASGFVGYLVEQITAAWRFRQEIIVEGKEAFA